MLKSRKIMEGSEAVDQSVGQKYEQVLDNIAVFRMHMRAAPVQRAISTIRQCCFPEAVADPRKGAPRI